MKALRSRQGLVSINLSYENLGPLTNYLGIGFFSTMDDLEVKKGDSFQSFSIFRNEINFLHFYLALS